MYLKNEEKKRRKKKKLNSTSTLQGILSDKSANRKKIKEKITQRPIYWLKYVFCLSYHCVTYVKNIILKKKNDEKAAKQKKKK